MRLLTKASMELGTRQASRNVVRISSIFAIGIESRRERCAKREPKSSERAEDNEGECVSKEEFQYPSEAHEKAADEVVSANCSNAVTPCSPPAHELA